TVIEPGSDIVNRRIVLLDARVISMTGARRPRTDGTAAAIDRRKCRVIHLDDEGTGPRGLNCIFRREILGIRMPRYIDISIQVGCDASKILRVAVAQRRRESDRAVRGESPDEQVSDRVSESLPPECHAAVARDGNSGKIFA